MLGLLLALILMAAPTLSDYQQSNYTDTPGAGSEATASATWSSGDVLVAVGVTEDNTQCTMATPTGTGLTFSAITSTNTGSNCKCYAWTATAASGGSGAISSVRGGAGGNKTCGLSVFVYSGSDGIGNSQLMASTATTNATQSLTRGFDNSAVVCAFGDWSAIVDTSVTTTPSSGGTVRVIMNNSLAYTAYVASWTDQGAAGSTSYGIAGYTATAKWIGLVIEIKGTAGGGPAFLPMPPVVVRQAVNRAGTY